MDATTIISAIGLAFAAVAAWGAWMTVRLTLQIQREANLRRVLGAVVSMEHAAEAIARVSPNWVREELRDWFRQAQADLDLALVLGVSVKGTWGGSDSGELQGLLDKLRTADPLAASETQATIADADRVRLLLTTQPPPKLMPKWWRRLVLRSYRARS